MSTESKRVQALSAEQVAAILAPFRLHLSAEQIDSIRNYVQLLLQWNRSISLTAIDDETEIIARHFGESLFAASFLPLGESRLADVGSGAGFPGLPLKIACPRLRLTLLESNSKKCAFLTEVAQRLWLSEVDVRRGRYEDFGTDCAFDAVCSRALGDYPVLLSWARRVLVPKGKVLLWLGTEEATRIGRRNGFQWQAPIPIPESRRRVILIGTAE